MQRRKFGFLYICLGNGCEGWQFVLTIITIVVAFLGCCLYGLCCNHNGDEGVEETEIERRVQEDKKWVLYENQNTTCFQDNR